MIRPCVAVLPGASSWFTLGMAAGMELMIESWNLCMNARIGRRRWSIFHPL